MPCTRTSSAIALVLAVMHAVAAHCAADEQMAIDQLKATRASLTANGEWIIPRTDPASKKQRLKSTYTLDCDRVSSFDDKGMKLLAEFAGLDERLTKVEIGWSRVTDTGLKELKPFANIDWLDLNLTPVTDRGLEELTHLKKLKALILSHTKITDAGLKVVGQFADLEFLNLSGTAVTDAGLAELSELTRLEFLHLRNTKVTGTGLKHLKTCRKLEFIDLDGSPLTDEGLESLAELTTCRNLEKLSLTGNDLTDDGIMKLKRLRQVDEILFSNASQLTAAGIQKLNRAMPLTDVGGVGIQ